MSNKCLHYLLGSAQDLWARCRAISSRFLDLSDSARLIFWRCLSAVPYLSSQVALWHHHMAGAAAVNQVLFGFTGWVFTHCREAAVLYHQPCLPPVLHTEGGKHHKFIITTNATVSTHFLQLLGRIPDDTLWIQLTFEQPAGLEPSSVTCNNP